MNSTSWEGAFGRTICSAAAGKELYVAINPNYMGADIEIAVPFAKADNNAYYIVSASYDSTPSFDAVNGKVKVPANCYVVIGSQNVSDVPETSIGNAHGITITTDKGSLHVENAINPVEIYDLSGRLIHREQSSGFTLSLSSGIYIVRSGSHSSKHLIQ